jgi:N6-adenosine-specific RNA methylase IME4
MEKYGLIVVDPPWQFGDKLTMSDVPRGADANYTTMSMRDVVTLSVRNRAADDAVLGLWCPGSMLSQGICAVEHYGFKQKQIWVWVKTGKGVDVDAAHVEDIPDEGYAMAFGMGRLARNACEFLLVGTRGKVYGKLENRSVRNVFFAPNTKHSAKPECVQDALDSMFPSVSKLELFARRQRVGWRTVGWECEGSKEDVRDFCDGGLTTAATSTNGVMTDSAPSTMNQSDKERTTTQGSAT